MYGRNDYGFPMEGRRTATVVQYDSDRGFGLVFPNGGRATLFFHFRGERMIRKVDGLLEWWRLEKLSDVPPKLGEEIIFDRAVNGRIDYWCFKDIFDSIYDETCRSKNQLAFAGC